MGTYLHLFENETQYQQKRDNEYEEPWVSYIGDIERVDFNKTEEEKLFDTPLTFEVLSDGLIYWKKNGSSGSVKTIEYKKNDGDWTSITSSTAGVSINVVSGDIVQFRGNNATYSSGSSRYNTFSGTTCQFKVKGNIMSLINDSSFSNLKTLSSSYNFVRFFQGLTGLTDASNLLLPATALTERCYYEMFMDCTNLTGCPTILPATTLTDYCYYSMFNRCSKITSVPTLPVTTLAFRCYSNMFAYCTSLTGVPNNYLPVTTLATQCYYGMFSGCTSLTAAPELPATTLRSECYCYMFRGCTSLTAAPELPATTLTEACYASMFYGCTSLTAAPELPADTMLANCYESMFSNCTSLTTAPVLPATTLATNCYSSMFSGCTSLNYVKCLATNISASNCLKNWVYGVASSGTFVKNPNMSSWPSGTSGIPTGWTVQDA